MKCIKKPAKKAKCNQKHSKTIKHNQKQSCDELVIESRLLIMKQRGGTRGSDKEAEMQQYNIVYVGSEKF